MKDADKAEVQYHFQKKIDRIKYSFVGSKLLLCEYLLIYFLLLHYAYSGKMQIFARSSRLNLMFLITVIQNADKLSLTPFLNFLNAQIQHCFYSV